MSKANPKIYVACLAAYNNGYLHGTWIDATQDSERIQNEINAMLKNSPIPYAEEWAIHDYEDFFDIKLSEYTSIETVATLAEFIEEHGELGAAVYAYINNDESGIEEATRILEENYQGEYDSEEKFAEQLFDDCYEIPDYLSYYIDYDAVARDLFINDYFSLNVNGSLHVFSSYR